MKTILTNRERRRSNETFLRRLESRLRSQAFKRFKKQQEWIIREMESLSFFQENSYSINSIEGDIDAFMQGMPESDELAEDIVLNARRSLDKGGKNIVRELQLGRFGIEWSLQNNDAIKFLGGKLSHELSSYRGNIKSTTVRAISKILKDAAETGQSYTKTAKLIEQQGTAGVFSRKRGELIAVREIGTAYEKGNNIPIKEFQNKFPLQVVQKAWQTVNDDRVTESHLQNQDDGWILEAEVFSGTGDQIAPASDNPRCRCFTKYRIQE